MKNLTIFAVLTLLCSTVANAAIIDTGNITQDTSTGLEWLDLTESTGFSVDDVNAGAGGFLADGWAIANVLEIDQLFINVGWDGTDDVSDIGDAATLIVVDSLLGLLGQTSIVGVALGEGWALTDDAGPVSRPFYTVDEFGPGLGRIACTSAGFIERPGDGTVDFANCGMPSDTSFDFIGVYLNRDITPTPASAPSTLVLMLIAAAAGVAWRRKVLSAYKAN